MVCVNSEMSFENKIIDTLLRSKYYMGRNFHTTDSDAYFKNKEICKIIDKLRYEDHNEILISKIKAILRRLKIKLDGGESDSIYKCNEHLDLGNAGSSSAELNYRGYCHKKINGGNAFNCNSETLDLGLASSDKAYIKIENIGRKVNGGHAESKYCRQIDLGDAEEIEKCFQGTDANLKINRDEIISKVEKNKI